MKWLEGEKIEIIEFIKKQKILKKDFLTLQEASIYLGQSKSSLYKLTSKREIPYYKPTGKLLYFKRTELDQWIFNNRQPSSHEIDEEVESFLGRKNHS